MTTETIPALGNRYDFVLLFDVTDGNPNGDPDAGNMPRVDPQTMHGFVTDVALKRKVRDYVQTAHGNEPPYRIYVQHQGRPAGYVRGEPTDSHGTPLYLNALHDAAHDAIGTPKDAAIRKAPKADQRDAARAWMCANFFDVRAFGAVMTTGSNAGQVRGPLQITFGRSIDPIEPQEVTLTRVAKTTAERAEKAGTTEIGRKNVVPYGLYRAYGFVSPSFARDTGFMDADLDLFWQALLRMFEDDRSASRGFMATRRLVAFKHDSPLGNAPAQDLLERVKVARKPGVDVARQFADYEVSVNITDLPNGVTIVEPTARYGAA